RRTASTLARAGAARHRQKVERGGYNVWSPHVREKTDYSSTLPPGGVPLAARTLAPRPPQCYNNVYNLTTVCFTKAIMLDTGTRKEQILQTAGGMFSRYGYHATTMRDIARELNIQGGSLYAHIESKEDVLWEIVERAAEQFLSAVHPLAALDQPASSRLRAMLQAHVEVVARNLDYATVFFHEWRFLSPVRRDRIKAQRDEYEALFRRVIGEGVEAGEFPHADAKLGATWVLSAGNWLYNWFSPDGPLSAAEVAGQMADFMLAGLRCVGSQRSGVRHE
ncbi:MAG TPA: TetR/AcrR family transcriptional regulator, partial [Chloroflexia bacterium]|nr:TetR/AcrR family transcriptional regulator [Chloroflexia bacterium]